MWKITTDKVNHEGKSIHDKFFFLVELLFVLAINLILEQGMILGTVLCILFICYKIKPIGPFLKKQINLKTKIRWNAEGFNLFSALISNGLGEISITRENVILCF